MKCRQTLTFLCIDLVRVWPGIHFSASPDLFSLQRNCYFMLIFGYSLLILISNHLGREFIFIQFVCFPWKTKIITPKRRDHLMIPFRPLPLILIFNMAKFFRMQHPFYAFIYEGNNDQFDTFTPTFVEWIDIDSIFFFPFFVIDKVVYTI